MDITSLRTTIVGDCLARTLEQNVELAVDNIDQTLLFLREQRARDPDRFEPSAWARRGRFGGRSGDWRDGAFRVSFPSKR